MATAKIHSEMMTQTVAATAISSSAQFCVVRDSDNNPMIFSIGDAGILYLIQNGDGGHKSLIALNKGFDLPTTSSVKALAVTQDPNGFIYLVFVEHVGSGEKDKIRVVSKIDPAFDWSSHEDLTSMLLEDKSSEDPDIYNKVTEIDALYMVGLAPIFAWHVTLLTV
jgi:hypothetical protein